MTKFSARPAVMAIAASLFVAMSAARCAPAAPAEAGNVVAAPPVSGGEWFVQTGCTACHSISVYNVVNVGAVGPDLSLAVEDVPRRFGVTLDAFLQAPTGTMSMVLSSRIPLTPEQRAVAIERLKQAYRRHQDEIGSRPVASH